jgi:hypothetical protein
MADLNIGDVVVIEKNNGSVYCESVTSIKPEYKIAKTKNFIINCVTLEVKCNEDNTYKLVKVWRLDGVNGDFIIVWQDGEKTTCQESEKACDIPYDVYMEVCRERDKLKEVVIFQAKAICDLHHALSLEEK